MTFDLEKQRDSIRLQTCEFCHACLSINWRTENKSCEKLGKFLAALTTLKVCIEAEDQKVPPALYEENTPEGFTEEAVKQDMLKDGFKKVHPLIPLSLPRS